MEEVDYTNTLSDESLFSIITLLPVRQWGSLPAVSKRWRRLCSHLPVQDIQNVRFYDASDHLPSPAPFPRALLRRCNISFSVSPGAQLEELLRRAEDVSVQQLILRKATCSDNTLVQIPELLFSIKSLTLLDLNYCEVVSCRFPLPRSHLRDLELCNCIISQPILDLILAESGPSLERFCISNCTGFRYVKVQSTSLKHLSLTVDTEDIVVDAPELSYFSLKHSHNWKSALAPVRAWSYTLFGYARNPSTDESNNLPCCNLRVLRGEEFLLRVEDLTRLSLNGGPVERFWVELAELETINVTLEKIKRLSATLEFLQLSFFAELLESCPSIKSFYLFLDESTPDKQYDISKFCLDLDRFRKLNCSSSHVKEVKICLKMMEESTLEFTRFDREKYSNEKIWFHLG